MRIEAKTMKADKAQAGRMRASIGASVGASVGANVDFAALITERRPLRTSAARQAAAVEGLLALQGGPQDDAALRRRRAKRGLDVVDALDALRRDDLGGLDARPALDALELRLGALDALDAFAPESRDPGLEDAVDALRLRVRVELAKRGL